MEIKTALAEIDQLDPTDNQACGGFVPQVEAADAPPEADASRRGMPRSVGTCVREIARDALGVLHFAPHGQDGGTASRTDRSVKVLPHRFVGAVHNDLVQILIERAVTIRDVFVCVSDHERPVARIGRQHSLRIGKSARGVASDTDAEIA